MLDTVIVLMNDQYAQLERLVTKELQALPRIGERIVVDNGHFEVIMVIHQLDTKVWTLGVKPLSGVHVSGAHHEGH